MIRNMFFCEKGQLGTVKKDSERALSRFSHEEDQPQHKEHCNKFHLENKKQTQDSNEQGRHNHYLLEYKSQYRFISFPLFPFKIRIDDVFLTFPVKDKVKRLLSKTEQGRRSTGNMSVRLMVETYMSLYIGEADFVYSKLVYY